MAVSSYIYHGGFSLIKFGSCLERHNFKMTCTLVLIFLPWIQFDGVSWELFCNNLLRDLAWNKPHAALGCLGDWKGVDSSVKIINI